MQLVKMGFRHIEYAKVDKIYVFSAVFALSAVKAKQSQFQPQLCKK